jgi:hypothetical protein
MASMLRRRKSPWKSRVVRETTPLYTRVYVFLKPLLWGKPPQPPNFLLNKENYLEKNYKLFTNKSKSILWKVFNP